jgi:hypothetical protein
VGQIRQQLVCNWPHSVGQNHFFVMMLSNRDFAIQSASRRFCTVCKSKNYVPCQPSGRRDILSECQTVQSIIRPDDENFPSEPSSVSGSHSVFNELWNFLPKHSYGKIVATVRTTWIPVQTRSFIRQVSHSNPDVRMSVLLV